MGPGNHHEDFARRFPIKVSIDIVKASILEDNQGLNHLVQRINGRRYSRSENAPQATDPFTNWVLKLHEEGSISIKSFAARVGGGKLSEAVHSTDEKKCEEG